MATYHVDLVNGNNANDGSTWALARKDIQAFDTVTVAGDLIKISKTPDPISIGNATWTNKSKDIVLETAQTKVVNNCETAWTKVGTPTVTVATSYRKQGTSNVVISFPSSGNAINSLQAYQTISQVDLSEYQELTFFLYVSNIVNADTLKICLCSDANGLTIVDTFDIPAIDTYERNTNTFRAYTLTKNGGGNLGSSIQSIALYTGSVVTTINSRAVWMDNISASKTNGLNLNTLISKNGLARGGTEGFYAIQSIEDTLIKIDGSRKCNAANGWGYWGDTENVETFMRTPFVSAGAAWQLTKSGTVDNKIIYEGGYNVVSNEVDGQTYLDGAIVQRPGITCYAEKFWEIRNINPFNYSIGLNSSNAVSSSQGGKFIFHDCNNNTKGVNIVSRHTEIVGVNINNNGTSTSLSEVGLNYTGAFFGTPIVNITNINSNANGIITSQLQCEFAYCNVCNNGNIGVSLSSGYSSNSGIKPLIVHHLNIYDNRGLAIEIKDSTAAFIHDLSVSKQELFGTWINLSNNPRLIIRDIEIINCTWTGGNQPSTYISECSEMIMENVVTDNDCKLVYIVMNSLHCVIRQPIDWTAINSQAGDHRSEVHYLNYISGETWWRTTNYELITYQTSIKPDNADGALLLSSSSSSKEIAPIYNVAFNANTLVTITMYYHMVASFASYEYAKLVVRRNLYYGITQDIEVDIPATAYDEWNVISISFTPTRKGAIPIEIETAMNESLYIASITSTQA